MAVLGYTRNIEIAIKAELVEPNSHFYLIEKEFWDSWVDNVNFKGDKSVFAMRQKRKTTIENGSIIEEGHQYRLREVNINEDYVVLPKYAYRFFKWEYGCVHELRRAVIKRPIDKEQGEKKKGMD